MNSRTTLAPTLTWVLVALIPSITQAEGDRTCDTELRIIDEDGKIVTEQPSGIAERTWFHYPDGPKTLESYASADVGGCTGSMIGPNMMMTSGHCGQRNRQAEFHLYTSPVEQTVEAFECRNVAHTYPDTDLSLYWCEANDKGENPGDKYGYLDFDVVINPGSGLLNVAESQVRVAPRAPVYSIWRDRIEELNDDQIHMLHSHGYVTGTGVPSQWFAPNLRLESGKPQRCSNTCCQKGEGCTVLCSEGGATCSSCAGGETCGAVPTRPIGVQTNLWSAPGASGAVQLSASTHRALLGPSSTVADDSRGRISLSMIDYLMSAYADNTLTCETCCFYCARRSPQINERLLTELGIEDSSRYWGYLDRDFDGLFDVQRDLERVHGEGARDWYWLGFESNRRNAQWQKENAVAFFSNSPEDAYATIDPVPLPAPGPVPVLTHEGISLEAGRAYRISYQSALVSYGLGPGAIRICLEGPSEASCTPARPSFLPGPLRRRVHRLVAPPNARLRIYATPGVRQLLARLSIIGDTATMDFDTNDKRTIWRSLGEPGLSIVPSGQRAEREADWALSVWRAGSHDHEWTVASSDMGLAHGQDYRICFDHALEGDPREHALALFRVVDGSGEVPGSVVETEISGDEGWQTSCTGVFRTRRGESQVQFGIEQVPSALLVDNIRVETVIFSTGFEK